MRRKTESRTLFRKEGEGLWCMYVCMYVKGSKQPLDEKSWGDSDRVNMYKKRKDKESSYMCMYVCIIYQAWKHHLPAHLFFRQTFSLGQNTAWRRGRQGWDRYCCGRRNLRHSRYDPSCTSILQRLHINTSLFFPCPVSRAFWKAATPCRNAFRANDSWQKKILIWVILY